MRQRVLILAFITIALCLGFFYIAVPTCIAERAGCLGYPVTPPLPLTAPGIYRLLWPALENWIAPTVGQSDPQILLVDTLLMFVCIALTIPALYLWLKQWSDPDRALLGVALFGAVYLVAYHLFFRGGGIPVEIALVCWSLVFVRRRWLWLAPLLVIGAFNRETSAVIVGIYAAYHGRDHWKGTLALAVIWAAITGGLHLALGVAEHQVGGIVGTAQFNLGNLSDSVMTNALFVPLVIALGLNYRHSPAQLKRLCWVAAVYTAVVILGGAWMESQRLLLPILPLIIPMVFNSSMTDTSLSSSMSRL